MRSLKLVKAIRSCKLLRITRHQRSAAKVPHNKMRGGTTIPLRTMMTTTMMMIWRRCLLTSRLFCAEESTLQTFGYCPSRCRTRTGMNIPASLHHTSLHHRSRTLTLLRTFRQCSATSKPKEATMLSVYHREVQVVARLRPPVTMTISKALSLRARALWSSMTLIPSVWVQVEIWHRRSATGATQAT